MLRGAAIAALSIAILAPCRADPTFASELAASGRLGVSLVEAARLESRLGQLLVVNVDGFGATGELAVMPAYLELVGRLQVGGVIPHYGRTSASVIKATNEALAKLTRLPLLIASDIVTLRSEERPGLPAAQASFGDGYVGGFIGKHRALPDRAFERLAAVNAFTLRALGMNCALWPTVDASSRDDRVVARAAVLIAELRRVGILATLKHWPMVPTGVDLHRESVDSRLGLEEVEKRAAPFRELKGRADLLMTTHYYDSLVDGSLVTLSQRWVELMRRSTKFRGPVITDGLFMLRSHRARAASASALPGLSRSGDDEIAGWAAHAILSGHDMVILEGSAVTSLHVYRRLLELACRPDALGKKLRGRIYAAFGKVLELKRRRAAELGATIELPLGLLDRLVRVLAGPGPAALADDGVYAPLAAEMDRASARRR